MPAAFRFDLYCWRKIQRINRITTFWTVDIYDRQSFERYTDISVWLCSEGSPNKRHFRRCAIRAMREKSGKRVFAGISTIWIFTSAAAAWADSVGDYELQPSVQIRAGCNNGVGGLHLGIKVKAHPWVLFAHDATPNNLKKGLGGHSARQMWSR
jgi:hypothetical protein